MNPKLTYIAVSWLALGLILLPVGVFLGWVAIPMGYAVCGPLVVFLAVLLLAWRIVRGYDPDDPYADREDA
jgi:cation transporter-like permease